MPRSLRSCILLVVAALAGAACQTPSGDEIDCGEMCGLALLGVLAIPCGVAAGVGCIGGGITRCGEGAPQADPAPSPAPAEAAPSSAGAAPMEY
ncbi:MAG: hypothetical protein IT383_23685 [Deltaproteobacteria bacterium]|nr:hypothetical protein [Deltaproteobacteria bacterium]